MIVIVLFKRSISVLETLMSQHFTHVGASVVVRKILEKRHDRHDHIRIAA